jgi:hypothetical protein
MTVTNQNCIHDEIKSSLNSGNTVSLLSSHFMYKNLKIKVYKTIILPVVLYGCETWFLILGEEHRLRVFEHNREKVVMEAGKKKLHSEALHNFYSSPNIRVDKMGRS